MPRPNDIESQPEPARPICSPWWVCLATGAYVGRLPVAPGTFGALWGIPLALGIHGLPSVWLQAAVIAVLCVLGIPLCTRVASHMRAKDPGAIVWDEIVSIPITFFMVSSPLMESPAVLIVGFLLNRVFDITKPPPARWLEGLPDGLGIMADDWMAGVYSCLALHGLLGSGVIG